MTERPVIPYGRQTVDEDDIAAVVEVLRSDFLTQGPAVVQFEEVVAERVQARFAVAFANGTAALHGACAVAGLGKGDRVATSALSFVASANCARYVGSEVEFVDIDPETLNLDTSSVREGLDGLVAVHYAGLPARLAALTNRPRVVIEDAAHALGAWTPHGPVGNCSHSDMTCFSAPSWCYDLSERGGSVQGYWSDIVRDMDTHLHNMLTFFEELYILCVLDNCDQRLPFKFGVYQIPNDEVKRECPVLYVAQATRRSEQAGVTN